MLNTQLLELYSFMVASRESDIVEAELVNSGEANFLASSKGHEGSVVIAPFLIATDWLHCHYRDKALMLARGVSNEMFLYSALCKAESHSAGRQMVSHMSAPELNILSLVGPVGNNALQAVGIAHAIKDQAENPIVFCSIGDGTSQQGEVLEAIAEAYRGELPVLFFIHNNNLAISTRTEGKTFFSRYSGTVDSFYGMPINYINGSSALSEISRVKSIIAQIRESRKPQIIVFNVERLDNHSNADDQRLYRDDSEIKLSQDLDPLIVSYQYLLKCGISPDEIKRCHHNAIAQVRQAITTARNGTEPHATFSAELPLAADLINYSNEYRGDFNTNQRFTMLEAMRQIFDIQLANDHQVILLGEDIEDGKGDVFGITRGLSSKYPGRVLNSALSESTIAGMCAGMALAGKKPVAFIQFADFLPLAYNQIMAEIATMYWRTNGGWQCPVILFAACGAFRPGLGPFHSQTNESTYAHIPGLDVYMPSNAADAAGILNAAFKSGRPSLFLYPKKLLNNGKIEDTTSQDVAKQFIPVGKARIVKPGSDITLVAWGNTVSLCLEVAETLEQIACTSEVLDLRTIKPYDKELLIASAEKTGALIVVHEDNLTCGVGGDILATIAEQAKVPVKLRRVTRDDTYVPCNFANQLEVLPSYERILEAAAALLNLKLEWQAAAVEDDNLFTVEVIGTSPSDESVQINHIHVAVGREVKAGEVLVDVEASKSAGEILAPHSGTVEEIYVKLGDRALVGKPLLKLRLSAAIAQPKTKRRTPKLSRPTKKVEAAGTNARQATNVVGMSQPYFRTGSRVVSNSELLAQFPDVSNDDIIQRTGIHQRHWLAPGETIIKLATAAAQDALQAQKLKLQNIDLIICATCSPAELQSPALSCLVLHELNQIYGEQNIPAYDLNAACSGYIFALQNAQDFLKTRPQARVLLLTAEALSPRINSQDFETAFLFADGATATILCGENHINECVAELQQIYISSIAEDGSILNIPTNPDKGILMQGKKLFSVAVKSMSMAIHKCCHLAQVPVEAIDLAVPHQANQRILTAVESRLKLPNGIMFSNIANYGNTSSCTIPIALSEALSENKQQQLIALCAFGAGFTAGAALLTQRQPDN
jgi:2-oxoisovalerate dehydrogenase E1 component